MPSSSIEHQPTATAHSHTSIYGLVSVCILAGSAALYVSHFQRSTNAPRFEFTRIDRGTYQSRALKVQNSALHFSPPRALVDVDVPIANSGGTARGVLYIVDKDDKLQPVTVRTLVRGDDYSEVISGELAEGTQVVAGIHRQ